MAANAKPDGYTIAQIPITVFRLPLMQKTTWDPLKDFTYIVHLTGYTFGVTAKADGQFKTWEDVVEFAKANPGKVTYGRRAPAPRCTSAWSRSPRKAGVKLTHVPFKGGAETNAAVLGGHIMLQADSTGWKPLVDAGQLRLLAIWTAERSKNWPDAPTLKELGYPFVFDSPFGLAGPKGMDPAVVEKLHDAFKKAHRGSQGRGRDRWPRTTWCPRYHRHRRLHASSCAEQVNEQRARIERWSRIGLSSVAAGAGKRARRQWEDGVIRNSELWGGLFWLAIGAFVDLAGRDMGLGALHEPGSGFAFFWIGILMCALALGVVGQAVVSGGPDAGLALGRHALGARCWLVVALLLVYGVVFERDRLHPLHAGAAAGPDVVRRSGATGGWRSSSPSPPRSASGAR